MWWQSVTNLLSIVGIIITIIGLAGIPDDLKNWERWLSKVFAKEIKFPQLVTQNQLRWIVCGIGILFIAVGADFWKKTSQQPYKINAEDAQENHYRQETAKELERENVTKRISEDLLIAVKKRDTDAVKKLLASGADIEKKDDDGRTPLIIAARAGDTPTVRVLLDAGANAHYKRHGSLPALTHAVKGGHVDVVTLLLDRGINIETRNSSGQTPLIHAITNYRYVILKILLNKGAEVNYRDETGKTPLDYAITKRDKETIEILQIYGARE